MSGNYIKLDRRILNWKWYSDTNTKVVFLHCLLRANWKNTTWKGLEIKRGQFITSLAELATSTSLTIQQARTALSHLETTNEITSQSTNKYRIITVNNYDKYQAVNKQDNRKPTSKQQAEQQSNNKQINNSTRKNTTYSIKEEEKEEREERACAREATPTLSEVREFFKGKNGDPDRFFNWYAARGWKLNGTPVADWRPLAENWIKNEKGIKNTEPEPERAPSYGPLSEYEEMDPPWMRNM